MATTDDPPDTSSSNGHGKELQLSSADLIEQRFTSTVQAKLEYQKESERRRQVFIDKLAELHNEREKYRVLASDHAGNIGLIYRSRNNSFSRVVIVDDLPSIAADRPVLDAEIQFEANSSEPSDVTDAKTDEPTSEMPGDVAADQSVLTESENIQDAIPEKPSRPVRPARPAPPKLEQIDKKWERNSMWKSGLAWAASFFVGLFVGFGLLTVTGLPYQKASNWVNLYGFLALGVAAIFGMKLLFDAVWYEVGRRKGLGTGQFQFTFLCTLLSIVILAVEATLGGVAIANYTKKASYQGSGALSLSLTIMLAVAVSTANLLYSAFIGYQKGLRSVTNEDIEKQNYRIDLAKHEEDIQLAEEDYSKELAIWQVEADRQEEVRTKLHNLKVAAIDERKSAHDQAVARWEAQVDNLIGDHSDGRADRTRIDEFESVQKLPDFQALCKYIGVVESLTVRIEEVERMMNNDSISRGHGRKTIL